MYVGSIVHPNQGVPILIESLPQVFDAVPESRCVLGRRPRGGGRWPTKPPRQPTAIG